MSGTLRVRHSLHLISRCPVNGQVDHYSVVVECDRVILVEDILAAVASYRDRKVYQEALTQDLADRLAATVTTAGHHSGVRTEATAHPAGAVGG